MTAMWRLAGGLLLCAALMSVALPRAESGYGRESGLQRMGEYLNAKAVWIKTA